MAVVIYAPGFDSPAGALCGGVWVGVSRSGHLAAVNASLCPIPRAWFWRDRGDQWRAITSDEGPEGVRYCATARPAAPRGGGLAPPPLPDFVVEVPRAVLEADGCVGAWKPTHVHAPPGLPPRYLYATKRVAAGETSGIAYTLEGWLEGTTPFARNLDGVWVSTDAAGALDLTPASTYEKSHG